MYSLIAPIRKLLALEKLKFLGKRNFEFLAIILRTLGRNGWLKLPPFPDLWLVNQRIHLQTSHLSSWAQIWCVNSLCYSQTWWAWTELRTCSNTRSNGVWVWGVVGWGCCGGWGVLWGSMGGGGGVMVVVIGDQSDNKFWLILELCSIFTRCQFWSSGIFVACICPSICPLVHPSPSLSAR